MTPADPDNRSGAPDLRPLLPPARDQGQRGTCVAFAVTAAHELDRADDAPVVEHLAEEALHWGCKQHDGDWLPGTSFTSAAGAISQWGQPDDATFPYDAMRQEGDPYHPAEPPDESWHRSGLRPTGAAAADLRELLDAGTAVVLGVILYDAFFTPTGGRIDDPTPGAPARGAHAVLAVGYGDEGMVIRNSWGTGWGDAGHAVVSDDYIDKHVKEAWVIDRASGHPAADPPDDDKETQYADARLSGGRTGH